ncbi:hypothetical protein IP70_24695 [alpha proteobacterium AAP38]|uniref:hypothetical protein n=1 Tax=Niveispirillum sp. TaxID=1917217 RepID=UPI0006B8981C|nr:hypothetical protein IP70_24695 [alpha proteobacterium AAP38]
MTAQPLSRSPGPRPRANRSLPPPPTTPFDSAEEAWFWFIMANEARQAGARIRAGQGLVTRPCEPLDILRTLDRLHRKRRLLRDHLLVLAHYGRRQFAPDPDCRREMRDHTLWCEAFAVLAPALHEKGIVT